MSNEYRAQDVDSVSVADMVCFMTACRKCYDGASARPDYVEKDGTVTFRRCGCGLLHVRHYDGYWWTSANEYNLDERLERWCDARYFAIDNRL